MPILTRYISETAISGYVHLALILYIGQAPPPVESLNGEKIWLAIIVVEDAIRFTIVWIGNRLRPAAENFISLRLLADGNLVLVGNNTQSPIWSSDTVGKGVATMSLSSYSASLVLRDANDQIVWQSADQPTDTLSHYLYILPGRNLTSWASPHDPSPGRYSLVMEPCGLALYMMGVHNPQRYWALNYSGKPFWTPTCRSTPSPLAACMTQENYISFTSQHPDQLPCFKDYGEPGNSREPFFLGSGLTPTNFSFLRLEHDGNLRFYTYLGSEDPMKQRTPDGCLLPNSCGPYGFCDGKGYCWCPYTYRFTPISRSDYSQGCNLTNELVCNSSSETGRATMRSLMKGVGYVANNYTPALSLFSEEECKKECENNCSCRLAFWRKDTNSCHHMDEVWSLRTGLSDAYVTYLKAQTGPYDYSSDTASMVYFILVVVIGGLIIAASFILNLCTCFRRFCVKKRVSNDEDDDADALLDVTEGLPSRFSYKDLHDITNGFETQLGRGAFGAVYAGQLPDGTQVAVKTLDSFNQGTKEFKAEIAGMGGISHNNLLRLRGFCAQKGHRLLVYDYMEKGSLDQWLFSDDAPKKAELTWRVRSKIALGIAQGISYLHNEARERVIHLDIKPQNVLLDDSFEAKVADFGLSRILKKAETHVMTAMRGTPGYLAPDWLKEGVIDEKCDVFSFGMLLMEIISGRKNVDYSVEPKERVYYPEWAFFQASKENISSLTDATLESDEDLKQLRQMIRIAFLCVLEDSTMRPSMMNVVNMMKGLVSLQDLELDSLLQGLLFVLRNPSSVARTQIGNALRDIMECGSNAEEQGCSSGGYVSSFTLSGR
ncbi:hypothetical protein KP509_07G001500 [Ceratopteris richardii]|uniref:Receptor-like serine/threonine-protein kinase n=1 Tax=Ceratopteris richardii TaxID=49495 RepID=A0A8T2UBG9_CERRI|nr:hypothetical protein KP509_07G001500 [Ceratopteris richardii]